MMVRALTLAVVCWLMLAGVAQADTVAVTRVDDPAGAGNCPTDCSLRQAVDVAADGDTVQLGGTVTSPAVYALTQGSALFVSRSLTLVGGGPGATLIDGSLNHDDADNRPDRILKVTGGHMQISGLTFTGGVDGKDENFASCSPCDPIDANGGGALFNAGASVTLERVVFDGNGSSVGGAIGNAGTLNLTDVDFHANRASLGGALFSRSGTVTANRVSFRDGEGTDTGGAVFLRGGAMTLTNSTVIGNGWPSSIGGGIVNQGGDLTLLNDTLAGNLRGSLQTHRYAVTRVRNTILGSGYAGGGNGTCVVDRDVPVNAVTVDLGNNIDQDGTCALTDPSSKSGVDPRLAPATDNGGAAPTLALLHGSVAIDGGSGCPLVDQRGISRTQDAGCDIGAFEAVRLGTPSVTASSAVEPGSTDVTLAATFNLAGEAGGLHFVWGTAPTALTETTETVAAGVLSSPTRRTIGLAFLDPGRTYYFQAVAENASAEARGAVLHFTTQPGPPAVSGLGAASVTDTTATLDFTIDPDGAATHYVIEYDGGAGPQRTASVDIGAAAGPRSLTQTITGLEPGTVYTFDVIATNAGGSSGSQGGTSQFTTAEQLTEDAGTPVTLSDTGNAYTGTCPTASIDWGDGTPADESAKVTCTDDFSDGPNYRLTATHAYASPGHFHIQIVYSTDARSDAWALISAPARPPTLSVALAGAGAGRVTGSGIDCPGACSRAYDSGTEVTLTAMPAAGSTFAGWGGTCSGTGVCTVTVDADTAVTASFSARSVQPAPSAVATPVPTVAPTPTPTPTPTPAPTFKQTVVLAPVSGKVLVKLKGSNTFVALDGSQAVPFGSQIDVTKGKITLTSIPKSGGTPETATFYDGIFTVRQQGSITVLTLSGPKPTCTTKGKASAAATKVKSRRLWGDGKGSFRTKGQYSAATIRGTQWLVEDSCSGTLTRVARGVVSVRDDVRHRTILVRAPKSYLARPPRR